VLSRPRFIGHDNSPSLPFYYQHGFRDGFLFLCGVFQVLSSGSRLLLLRELGDLLFDILPFSLNSSIFLSQDLNSGLYSRLLKGSNRSSDAVVPILLGQFFHSFSPTPQCLVLWSPSFFAVPIRWDLDPGRLLFSCSFAFFDIEISFISFC